MNKVMLMGRLTRDPEVRYSQSAEPVAVARFTLAVNRKFKREGEPDADFINCVSFGKSGEFTEKYFKKGQMVAIVGHLQVRSWDDNNGQKHWTTEVVVEEQHFAESRSSFEANRGNAPFNEGSAPSNSGYNTPKKQPSAPSYEPEGFSAIAENIDDEELPF